MPIEAKVVRTFGYLVMEIQANIGRRFDKFGMGEIGGAMGSSRKASRIRSERRIDDIPVARWEDTSSDDTYLEH